MNAPSRGRVEKPGEAVNVEWQTRRAAPTEFENRMGDVFEKVFDSGVEALPAVVAKINELGSRDPEGKPWTEDSLQAWLRQRA